MSDEKKIVTENECRQILSDIASSEDTTASEKMKAISLLQGFSPIDEENEIRVIVEYSHEAGDRAVT